MNRKNLILPELLIGLLFFVLAATILIQVFVYSFLLERKNEAQTHALVEVQNLLETVKADPVSSGDGLAAHGMQKLEDGRYQKYLDANWTPTENGRYRVDFVCQEETSASGVLHGMTASCVDTIKEEVLVTLSTSVYEQGGAA